MRKILAMPIYSYKGINKQGQDVKNTINCESEAVAKQRIKSQGVMLVSIKEKKAGSKSSGSSFSLTSKKVNVNELAMMTRQLATLVKARIQIVDSLQALIDQVESDVLRVVLATVKTQVNEGVSLAKALGEHPKVFNNVYCNMVEAGEASGTLDVVLLRLAEFTESQVKLKNKVVGAMTYPIIIVIVGFAMMMLIFLLVIPQIAKMFKSAKKELPILTKIVIGISDFLQNYWYMVILGMILFVFLVRAYINSPSGQRRWHSVQLKLPIVGNLIKMINVSRFCSTLGTLLNSGVPILASMKIVKNLIPNVWMKDSVEESRISISEGSSMAGPLMKSGYFPTMVTYMISLGEKTGELEPMLEIISANYEDQVEAKLSGLTSIIEPIMMIGMGGAVGLIIFSIVIPLMELNKI